MVEKEGRNAGRIMVVKMDGEKEPYDSKKLSRSLRRSGADNETIDNILEKVEKKKLHDGIKTKELFSFIHKELDKTRPGVSLKYDLKQAMAEMRIHGGYTFEKFVGLLMKKLGYGVKVNPIIKGKHVTHEIDVSAEKGKEKLMVEVKHRVKSGERESIQTALYVYARYLELEDKFTKPMLVTNAKFSNQVKKYAKGVGLELMGWRYPAKNSLEDNIARYKIYPITALSMSEKQKKEYLEEGILTIQQLKEKKKISSKTLRQINAILEEGDSKSGGNKNN